MSATKTKTGTLQYMPPEAFEKEAKVSPHTDIWAVGVIFQQLLSGKMAFPQDSEPALLAGILFGEPEALPTSIPRELREIVEKALRKKREDRFQTAREMLEALEGVWRGLQLKETLGKTISDQNSFDKTLQLDEIPADWLKPPVNQVYNEEAERLKKSAEHQNWLVDEVRRKREEDEERRSREAEVERRQQQAYSPPQSEPAANQPLRETQEIRDISRTKEPQEHTTNAEIKAQLPPIPPTPVAIKRDEEEIRPQPNGSEKPRQSSKKTIYVGAGIAGAALLATTIGIVALNPFGSSSNTKIKVVNINAVQSVNASNSQSAADSPNNNTELPPTNAATPKETSSPMPTAKPMAEAATKNTRKSRAGETRRNTETAT